MGRGSVHGSSRPVVLGNDGGARVTHREPDATAIVRVPGAGIDVRGVRLTFRGARTTEVLDGMMFLREMTPRTRAGR